MSKSEQTLVCRICQRQPELVKEEGRSDAIRCPVCGESSDLNEAVKRAAQQISGDIINDLQNRLSRSMSGSKSVRYIRGNRKNMSAPRFVFR